MNRERGKREREGEREFLTGYEDVVWFYAP